MASNKRGPGKVGQRVRINGKWVHPEALVKPPAHEGEPEKPKEAKRATRKVQGV